MNKPPTPPNGAAHSLHLGELGIRLWILRSRRNGDGLSRICRHFSSGPGCTPSSPSRVHTNPWTALFPQTGHETAISTLAGADSPTHQEGVLLLPREAVRGLLREIFAGAETSMADELIRDRRAAAAEESKDL
jgi:hypothetical protein